MDKSKVIEMVISGVATLAAYFVGKYAAAFGQDLNVVLAVVVPIVCALVGVAVPPVSQKFTARFK
jgi:hypothetical protein